MWGEDNEAALCSARADVERLQRLAIHLDYLARSASKKLDKIESAEGDGTAVWGLMSVGHCVGLSVDACDEYSKEAKERRG